MRITCIQMDMAFCAPDENFSRAEALIRKAAASEHPDTVVLPETWNTGFFPREELQSLCDEDGARTRALLAPLAKELCINIVAGSVTNCKDGAIYNTAYVFDRKGACVAEYDKTHLFTPMGEDRYFRAGNHLSRFTMDGANCAILICYDLRFPELTRTLALEGLDILFIVSQWPAVRLQHLQLLTAARAVENQMFTVCCNSCGCAGDTRYGGGSQLVDPWGVILARAGAQEQLLTADLDLQVVQNIRSSIPVFRDRRPELYFQKRG